MLHIWPCLCCYMPILGRVGRQRGYRAAGNEEKIKALDKGTFCRVLQVLQGEDECRSRGVNQES